MPVLDMDPGTSPEAPGTLSFFEQGKAPTTGFQVTSKGVLTAPGGQDIGGDLDVTGDLLVGGDAAVTGGLDVDGFSALGAAQTSGNFTIFGSALVLGVAGTGLQVKEGADATMGVATLVAGAATVNTNKVTANSRIFVTSQADGGAPGFLRVSARVAATSFTITSGSGTDTSTVAWWLVEPAA